MTLAIKDVWTKLPLWKWILMVIKTYLIVYILFLLYTAAIRTFLYFSGLISMEYGTGVLLEFTYFPLCGIVWFTIKNKQNMSHHINTGKRSKEYKARTIIIVGIAFLGVIIQRGLNAFSYEVQFFFPESILLMVFSNMEFANEILSESIFMWLWTSTNIFDLFIISSGFYTFVSYNVMKYFFDKSIME